MDINTFIAAPSINFCNMFVSMLNQRFHDISFISAYWLFLHVWTNIWIFLLNVLFVKFLWKSKSMNFTKGNIYKLAFFVMKNIIITNKRPLLNNYSNLVVLPNLTLTRKYFWVGILTRILFLHDVKANSHGSSFDKIHFWNFLFFIIDYLFWSIL